MKRASILVGLVVAAATGCIAPASPPPVRYFSLEGPAATAEEHGAVAAGVPLRLRHVRAAAHIDEKIVWRSDVEVGFYDDEKWCQPPAAAVERDLSHALFVGQGVLEVSITAPTLDVEITALEEVVAPAHEARVTLVAVLRDPAARTRSEWTITESRPVTREEDPAAFARALQPALAAAVARVRDAVVEALARRPVEKPSG